MYETSIAQTGIGIDGQGSALDAEGLRALSWGELTARLAAARDFRRVLGGRLLAGASSFNLASARHLAGRGDGKPGINPFALANGKIADGIRFSDTGNDAAGGRGK